MATEGTIHQPPVAPHLLDYLRILHKRRWPAVAVLVLTFLAAFVYTETTIPLYEARVQLLIDVERPRVVLFKDTIEQDSDKADYQETQHKILESRALAERVLDTLGLWRRPELTGEAEQSVLRRLTERVVAVGGSGVARVSQSKPPAGKREASGATESPDRSRVIDGFLDRLTIAPVRNSRLVNVEFRATDPKLAADIVNTLADAYIKQSLEFKSKSSKEAADWLSQQLDEQRKRVEASQAALQQYREQTEAVSTSERQSAVQQKMNELNGAVTKAHIERTQKEFLFNELHRVAGDSRELLKAPTVSANSAIQGLQSQLADLQRQQHQMADTLGAKHPDFIRVTRAIESMQARLDAQAQAVVDGVQAEFVAARAQEENLVRQLDAQERSGTAMQRTQVKYDALEREATSDQQIFESLLQRTKETGVSSEMMNSNIRVVDAADAPRTPVSPQKFRDLSLAMGVGLMLAVGTAFVIDYLDKRIKTPEELKAQLGLPCLGLIPSTSAQGEETVNGRPFPGAGCPLLNNGVSNLYKESFRSVRTSLLFASAGEARHSLLITSTSPNEGKSVVASNLAIGLAQTGRRVLLIDGDLRRPSLHTLFDVAQSPGLSELVQNTKRLADVIHSTSVQDLSLVSAGALPDNPTELLSSERFKSFLDAVTANFDWVIIDSPPVMAVTDAVLIANVVGGVAFVVGAQLTAGPMALNALEKLHAANARFVGAILNRVELERNAFYYADHYRSDYKAYYLN